MPRKDLPKNILILESEYGDLTELLLEHSMEYFGNFWLYLNNGSDQVECILTPEQLLELCKKGMVAANKAVTEKEDDAKG